MQQQQESRHWGLLKGSKRGSVPLNNLRIWVESTVPETEKLSKGVERPDKKLVFLLGDPTAYQRFKTPEEYKEIALNVVGKRDGYTDFQGDFQVRDELAKDLSTEKWPLKKEDIVLTAGGTQSLFFATLALAQEGDKILVPRPTFPLINAFATFFGIECVFYDLTPPTWQPHVEQLEELYKVHNNFKFILINSPSNPLGSVFSEQSIKDIITFCGRHNNLPIVSDEIYEEMIFNVGHFKFLSEYSDDVPVIRCSGLTKRCLVPGWRLGWIVMFGKGQVFEKVKYALKHLSNIYLMPNTICQMAAIDVYRASSHIVPKKMPELQDMYNLLKNGLSDAHGIKVGITEGAMYSTIIIDFTQFKDIKDSIQFAKLLQIEENVLTFPGELFYGAAFVRLVICCDNIQIEEACIRIKRFTQRHRI